MSAATILTLANGKGINLLDPKPDDIDFNVVAEQLAKENRYNGATPDVEYSVAEHCVRGCDAILSETGDATLAAYFLLHDAHEHALKDNTTPRKRAIAELAHERFGMLADHVLEVFKLLEYRHDVAIHTAAGLAWPPPSQNIVAQVKLWDLRMFVTEWRDLMHNVPHPNWKLYEHIVPLRDVIVPWPTWQMARKQFVLRAWKYLPALQGQLALVDAS